MMAGRRAAEKSSRSRRRGDDQPEAAKESRRSRRAPEPAETVADYDVRSPAVRTIITVASTLVAVTVLGALVLGASILTRDTRVATSQVDMGGATQLVVTTTNANIRIGVGEPTC